MRKFLGCFYAQKVWNEVLPWFQRAWVLPVMSKQCLRYESMVTRERKKFMVVLLHRQDTRNFHLWDTTLPPGCCLTSVSLSLVSLEGEANAVLSEQSSFARIGLHSTIKRGKDYNNNKKKSTRIDNSRMIASAPG